MGVRNEWGMGLLKESDVCCQRVHLYLMYSNILLGQNGNTGLVIAIWVKLLHTNIATVPHNGREIIRIILGQRLHDPGLDRLGIELALGIRAAQLALEEPEENLDRVIEGAVGWQEQDDNASSAEVVDNRAMAVDLGTVHDPNRPVPRVCLNVARVHELLAALEELVASECAFGWDRVEESLMGQEAEKGDTRKADIFAVDEKSFA